MVAILAACAFRVKQLARGEGRGEREEGRDARSVHRSSLAVQHSSLTPLSLTAGLSVSDRRRGRVDVDRRLDGRQPRGPGLGPTVLGRAPDSPKRAAGFVFRSRRHSRGRRGKVPPVDCPLGKRGALAAEPRAGPSGAGRDLPAVVRDVATRRRQSDAAGQYPRCGHPIAFSLPRGPDRVAVAGGGQALGTPGTGALPYASGPQALPFGGPRLRVFGRSVVPLRSRCEGQENVHPAGRARAAPRGRRAVRRRQARPYWPAMPRAGWSTQSWPFAPAAGSKSS